jgi:predicted transcriptional regulator
LDVLHKLRRAMVRPGRDRLTGEIEEKSIVVIAAEKNGRAIGRIRLKRVKDVSAESLLDFIRENVSLA